MSRVMVRSRSRLLRGLVINFGNSAVRWLTRRAPRSWILRRGVRYWRFVAPVCRGGNFIGGGSALLMRACSLSLAIMRCISSSWSKQLSKWFLFSCLTCSFSCTRRTWRRNCSRRSLCFFATINILRCAASRSRMVGLDWSHLIFIWFSILYYNSFVYIALSSCVHNNVSSLLTSLQLSTGTGTECTRWFRWCCVWVVLGCDFTDTINSVGKQLWEFDHPLWGII